MKKIIKNPRRDIPNIDGKPLVTFDKRFRSAEEELLWRREQMDILMEVCGQAGEYYHELGGEGFICDDKSPCVYCQAIHEARGN